MSGFTSEHEIIFKDSQQSRHLTEKNHSVVESFQLRQNPIQKLELSRRTVQISPNKAKKMQKIAKNFENGHI